MANIINPGNFHPRRINQYVARMQYSSDVNYNGSTRVSFGAPSASSANNVLNAASIAAATTFDLSGLVDFGATWGRAVTLIGSATVLAGTSVTLSGYDYLGQPMTEAFTTVAGVTPIVGLKAFKSFRSVTVGANAGTAPVTLSIGQNNKFGLPYRVIGQRVETSNGTPTGTQGTLVAGPVTAPTIAVGQPDPRGTYLPNTVPNGANIIAAHFDFASDLFGAGEIGGLMGFAHAA